MSEPTLQIDADLLAEFLDESMENLSGLDPLFVELEQRPGDLDVVNAIFRPVHSVKGNSAFFGMNRVKSLAHELETLLDLVRKKALGVTQRLIDVLLGGTDELKRMFERVRAGQPQVVEEDLFEALVERVKAASHGEQPAGDLWTSIFSGLVEVEARLGPEQAECRRRLDEVVSCLCRVAPEGARPREAVAEASPKGVPGPAGEVYALLADPWQGSLPKDGAQELQTAIDALQASVQGDEARQLAFDLVDIFTTFAGSVGVDPLCRELLLEKVEPLLAAETASALDRAAQTPEASPAGPAPEPLPVPPTSVPRADGEAKAALPHESQKTMRVAEAQIDMFLAYVGELLVVGDMFGNLARRMGRDLANRELVSDFKHVNQTFSVLSQNLQKSIMAVRKTPVKPLLQKVPRMVRDIATAAGKEIAVELRGEGVEVDKSLVDLIDAPLTHMVRNAADHGVERPEKRLSAGKDPRGTISVGVEESGDFIVLTVQDDGGGLPYDAIRRKAESLGLVGPGQKLEEADVVRLIFASGVSTAEAITDVSGRGVGMDVVRRTIDEAGGSIRVSSEPGKGTTFRVMIPKSVTTQIMPGFLIRAGGQPFVLPLDRIRDTSSLSPDAVETVAGRGRCVLHHGEIYPLLSLGQALGLGSSAWDEVLSCPIMVSVASRTRRFALAVDEVLGVQQVVLRQIEGIDATPEVVGGALLGDGSLALVLDVDRLCLGEAAQ